MVVANVTVTGDGIDFQAPNLELRVAPAQIEGIPVEDLPKALAGNKAGDTCTMKTKVPSGHPNESWRDKDVTLTLAVQEIKRLEAPELDEDLARQASFGSVEELRETFRSNLEVRVAAEQVRSMHGQVKTYFLEQTDFDVPEGVASRHASRLLARRYVDLLIQGVSREQLDENIQELEAAAASQAAQETKLSFILDKLIEAEGIEVSDAEVNARIAQIARRQRRRPERLRQELSNEGALDHLTTAIREEKAIDKVLESAKIVEAPAEAAPAKADAAKGGKKAPAKTTKKGASRKKRSRASKEKG